MATTRGPRLGTKLFILTSFLLVVIPWFSYLYLAEMEDVLLESQRNAQLLTARGVATLLNGRNDLFDELPINPDGYEQLYAYPLEQPIRIDGNDSDWEDILDYNVSFGSSPIASSSRALNQFYLVLGEHNGQVYALVQVVDDQIVFRNRNILRLDLSDHIRLTFKDSLGETRKIVITATEPGVTTAYEVDDRWRYDIDGAAENQIPGVLVETSAGYAVEFRVPLSFLGEARNFGLAVVDVDSEENRAIESITGTLPSAGIEAFGLVLLKSPEILRIIEGLGYSGANIQVIDVDGRIRAEIGSYADLGADSAAPDSGPWADWLGILLNPFYLLLDQALSSPAAGQEETLIKTALAGAPSVDYVRTPIDGNVIVAAHPIVNQSSVIGTVVLKQTTDRISEIRREALQTIVNFSLVFFFLFALVILTFSARLTRRIRKLGNETANVLDSRGRLTSNRLSGEMDAGDEIGDLARRISGMLSRMHQHNQFLENMPRTLRHEINNPLNTLSTSLHNLAATDDGTERERYLESAQRGLNRIGLIVQNLADAANLEDALIGEDLERIDLTALIQSYLNNLNVVRPETNFIFQGTTSPIYVMVSDFRIEQLLDKLVDNALDFASPDSPIVLSLHQSANAVEFSLTNSGATIPTDMLEAVFDSMISIRPGNPDNRLHFGMGLHVVRVIAEHHGGSVSIENVTEPDGVKVSVNLPLAGEPSTQSI
ncbi:MAG: ATP-binding protein [Gammaproteobacteria bacterium]|jgi:two-component system sensor histidine kinase ChvG